MTEGLLTTKEAAELLALKPSTIRRWVYARKIPFVKLGSRAVRFRKRDLDRVIQAGERPALRPVTGDGAER